MAPNRDLRYGDRLLTTRAFCDWIRQYEGSDLQNTKEGTLCHIAEDETFTFLGDRVRVWFDKVWVNVPLLIAYGMRAAFLSIYLAVDSYYHDDDWIGRFPDPPRPAVLRDKEGKYEVYGVGHIFRSGEEWRVAFIADFDQLPEDLRTKMRQSAPRNFGPIYRIAIIVPPEDIEFLGTTAVPEIPIPPLPEPKFTPPVTFEISRDGGKSWHSCEVSVEPNSQTVTLHLDDETVVRGTMVRWEDSDAQ